MATAITSNRPAAARGRGVTLSAALLAFMTFFIIALPKGGIKVSGIPLTFGYAFTIVMLLIAMVRANRLSFAVDRFMAFLPCLILTLWSALIVFFNGTDSAGFTTSYFISILYLPFFGLVFFSSIILDESYRTIENSLLWAVRFIVVYGIFLFFFKQLTGRWIEIPYLTVNVADVGHLNDKFIRRGAIFKLISTYNNGNIFGVSLAIMAPLYVRIENNRYMHWIMYTAMLLTLSRTVWIATILVIFSANMSKGLKPLTVFYFVAGVLVSLSAIIGLLNIIGFDISFLYDSNLGGRINQLDVLNDVRIIPELAVSTLTEIVYLGMLKYFGIPGLFLFIIYLTAPLLVLKAEGVRLLAMSRSSACMQGLLIYVVIAGADAAFSYIPVMMIFWMVAGLGFWYAHREAAVPKGYS